ncbi:hypothetical protein KSP40_PGU012418 [Platanthera guangdongensis]|uniref:Uncharacterized protein n=1 Tax=Platanthera guangdongensis TaxID=2320717 RepID=A0ABR2ML33_9ASPA
MNAIPIILNKLSKEPPKIQISSALFTIPEAIRELGKYPEVMGDFDFYDYCTLFLRDKSNRETFMSIPEELKLRWLKARYTQNTNASNVFECLKLYNEICLHSYTMSSDNSDGSNEEIQERGLSEQRWETLAGSGSPDWRRCTYDSTRQCRRSSEREKKKSESGKTEISGGSFVIFVVGFGYKITAAGRMGMLNIECCPLGSVQFIPSRLDFLFTTIGLVEAIQKFLKMLG